MKIWLKRQRLKNKMKWRAIPGFTNYDISENGQVRRSFFKEVTYQGSWRGRLIKAIKTGKYLSVRIKGDNGKLKTMRNHVLVTLAFHGPRPAPPNYWALHKDDNPLHNHYKNMFWGSPAQNTNIAIKNGKIKTGYHRSTPWQHGENGPNAKLTSAQVHEIRAMQHTVRVKGLALRFGVSTASIRNIIKGKTYKE